MTRASDLRQRMMELDDQIADAIDSGAFSPEEMALLFQRAEKVENEYYNALDEEYQTFRAMENGLGYW